MTRTGWSLAAASSWRANGYPRLLPVNVTVSANYRCNFKCLTCNVYDRKVTELTTEEWTRVFESMGSTPTWMTFSGGEPFLRRDLPDIILAATRICQPAVVNVPTNGWFTKRVITGVERICAGSPDTQVVINLSMDHHVPHRHDEIRAAPGSYERLLATLAGLRALNLPNLTVGIHTVVSNQNEDDFPEVARGLAALGADSYIAEPAEERVELQTIGTGITPRSSKFGNAAAAVLEVEKGAADGVIARVARSVRGEYYDRVTRFLDGEETAMPTCQAGFLSVHLVADGDVWSCCVISRSFGNLRDHDFDFKKVWFGPKAEEFRSWMRSRRCACPLANAAYTNLLAEPAAAARIAINMVRPPTRVGRPQASVPLAARSGANGTAAGVAVTTGTATNGTATNGTTTNGTTTNGTTTDMAVTTGTATNGTTTDVAVTNGTDPSGLDGPVGPTVAISAADV
ncbi:MAG: radical SAM/SPASM domain-containing protein [Acidimicrobiales bacterium]